MSYLKTEIGKKSNLANIQINLLRNISDASNCFEFSSFGLGLKHFDLLLEQNEWYKKCFSASDLVQEILLAHNMNFCK